MLFQQIKNSGYVGGQFLRRQPINHISASDMYVGNVVEVVGHQFLLRDANESTFKLMECDEKTFPYSDTARLQRILSSKQDMIRAYFVSHYDGNGMLDLEGLRQLCVGFGRPPSTLLGHWDCHQSCRTHYNLATAKAKQHF